MDEGRLARGQKLLKWILGHAVVAMKPDGGKVRVRVGEHEFTERRTNFPSEQFTAEIALCIDAAGYSRDAFDIGDFDPDWVMAALRIFDTVDDLKEAANVYAWENRIVPSEVFMFMGERMP